MAPECDFASDAQSVTLRSRCWSRIMPKRGLDHDYDFIRDLIDDLNYDVISHDLTYDSKYGFNF